MLIKYNWNQNIKIIFNLVQEIFRAISKVLFLHIIILCSKMSVIYWITLILIFLQLVNTSILFFFKKKT